jgi:hypothetical protein
MQNQAITKEHYLEVVKTPLTLLEQNDAYYGRVYDQMKAGTYACWNWNIFLVSVFGFSTFWMLYRRLYLVALFQALFLMAVVSLCRQLVPHSATTPVLVVFMLNMCISTILGMFGNALHFTWVKNWPIRMRTKVPTGADVFTPALVAGYVILSLAGIIPYGISRFTDVILLMVYGYAHYVNYGGGKKLIF